MEQRKHEGPIHKHQVKRHRCRQCQEVVSSSSKLLEHTSTQHPENAVKKSPVETAAAASPPTTARPSPHTDAASLVVSSNNLAAIKPISLLPSLRLHRQGSLPGPVPTSLNPPFSPFPRVETEQGPSVTAFALIGKLSRFGWSCALPAQ